MKKPLTDEDMQERSAIDGRVAFAAAAFLGAAALVALLDRVGVPERLVETLGPAAAVLGLSMIGVLLRSMRVSRFYAGGRAVPSAYAGLALAAVTAGLFLPFLPPANGAISLRGLLLGFASGIGLAALVTGPLLRKTGAFSIPDLIAARFPNIALRLGVITVVAAASLLVAFAGYSEAVESFSGGLGASRLLGIVLVGATLVLVAAPGGLAGVVWAASGASGIFIAALLAPLATLAFRGVSLPFPVIGDRARWDAALARMAEWQMMAGESLASADAMVIIAMILGLGTLAPVLGPAIVCANRTGAQRAGVAALTWGLLLATAVAATMAGATLAFDRGVTGTRPLDISAPVLIASGAGQVRICNSSPATAAAAVAACAARPDFQGVLKATDVSATGPFLIHAAPDMLGFGRAFSGLATAGLMAVAIALAAAGFHAFATAIGHDGFYRVRDETAMTSRRLAVTRTVLILGVIAAGVLLANFTFDSRALIGLAIALCASAIAPLLMLSLWPRAESSDATIALLAGLATTETVIFIGGASPSIEVFARAAVIAATASFSIGLAASLWRRPDQMGRGGAFVHSVLHGEVDVVNPDKGV